MIRLPPRSTPFPTTTLFQAQPLEAAARPEALGVPLHGDAEARRRPLDRLDDAVDGARRHPEALAQLVDRLVVADRKSTRLNSSHANISYAVSCLKKKKTLHP